MASSIVSILASILSYLAAKGLDKIIGKWVAYFTIAWEMSATINSRLAWKETIRVLKLTMPGKIDAREEWRRKKNGETQ